VLPFGVQASVFACAQRSQVLLTPSCPGLTYGHLRRTTPRAPTWEEEKNLLMKLAFTIIVAVALASIATVAEAKNSSASNQVSTPHDLGNRTNLAQRKRIPKPPYQSDPMKQYEQDKAKGWYKADRA